MKTKHEMYLESLARVNALKPGEPVTNICAGESNPQRHAYFVKLDVKSRRNAYGVVHITRLARCTDKKGKFWKTGLDVIYPGHIDYAESCRMFEPVHAVMFGSE